MKKFLMILVLAVFLTSCNQEKTAYVDTTQLIQEYKEMKDVEAEFSTKSDSVRKQLDAMAKEFQEEVQAYQSEMDKMSQAKRKEKEQELMQKQQRIQQQQQMQGNQLRKESDAVIDSIVEKVKDYVGEYGKENGYTYIFGSNESANIMYAEDGRDLTDEILTELNKDYKKN
ncbi:periplasmic chaperone for outer membrane proteins Skp [Salegentibacter echinorum]|uniref:Type IV secretion system putative lipoprotein virB7 n=1 Tax=Salegentibacter echinorum TaxID=1073325 RepID=A0A1M5DXS0_SALEC|nr:OmpH family outer membrane protein [Salegentibacter echinorum]SHF71674.1 periplasmic chaperone for outer membrane proteins Skp [Salegentibacter echinorum]